jgi:HlyD family secretion protein
MKQQTHPKQNAAQARRISYCGLVCALLFIPVAIGGFATNGAPDLESMGLVTESVKQERFIKSIQAFGDIRTYNPVTIKNDCLSRERRILELIPEGSYVEADEIVCVLDTSDLQARLDLYTITLIRAKAGLATAIISESLQGFVNSRRLSTRRYRDAIASGQLHAYEQAEAATEIERLEGDVRLKEEILQTVKEEFESTHKFTALGYRNSATLMAVEAKQSNARTALENAKGTLKLAKEFQQPRDLIEFQGEAENARKELARAALQNKLSLKVIELKTLEMQRRLSIVQKQVDQTIQAIESCTLRAPKAGEIVYCHNRERGRLIDIGQFAYYKQDLIRVSNRSRLIVTARVSDRQAHELRENQPVEFRVQSNPDQTFQGTLAWISARSSTPSRYQPYERYHDVEISVDQNQDGFDSLPLGSTVVAEIFVDDRLDVFQVPVNAVFNHHGAYAVLAKTQSVPCVRVVELGANNESTVEILSGLNSSENVVTGDQQTLQKLADSVTRHLVDLH